MTRIHCLNNISSKGTDQLPKGYEFVDELAKADGVLVRSAALNDTDFPDSLLAIARAGAGVNNIPLSRCTEQGIVVFNTPGANANAVKELVLAGMLLGSRGIVAGANWVRDNANDPNVGKSAEKVKKVFAGREILGKKLGVIGLGAIGSLVANAAIDLGMQVYGYDPYVSVDAAWRLSKDVCRLTDLNELCAHCDFISIHIPATEATLGMIGADQISVMKSDAVLLNFARNTLVDEEQLVIALVEGKLGCYITDFANPTILSAPPDSIIVLPHLGASTVEAEDNCAIMAVREMVDFFENGNIVNSVNFPTVNLGPRPTVGQRIAIAHKNVPGVINAITETIVTHGHNLSNILSKARGEIAYALVDIDDNLDPNAVELMQSRESVIRARIV